MSSITLYDAAEDLRTLFDTLDGLEDPQQIAEFEKEMEPAFARALTKVEAFAGFLRHLDSQAELCAAEVKRITAAKKRFEAMKERLETYAIRAMQANGVSRMDAPTASLRLQANPPSVVIEDAECLPERFATVTVKLSAYDWSDIVDWAQRISEENRGEAYQEFYARIAAAGSAGKREHPLAPIAAALKAGEEVPGARLDQKDRLVVK